MNLQSMNATSTLVRSVVQMQGLVPFSINATTYAYLLAFQCLDREHDIQGFIPPLLGGGQLPLQWQSSC